MNLSTCYNNFSRYETILEVQRTRLIFAQYFIETGKLWVCPQLETSFFNIDQGPWGRQKSVKVSQIIEVKSLSID